MSNAIIENRWLTGADIDPESVRINKNGSFWLGDEFEPFLINPYTSGKVLCQEIPLPAARCPLPAVMSPDNPNRNNAPANLPSTGGFEGMAINPAGDTLYPMLETTVQGDPEKKFKNLPI